MREPELSRIPESRLSLTEIDIVQGALERLEEAALRRGIEIRIETDFEEFARLRRAAGGVVNQTLDPSCSRLDRDAFWVRVSDLDGALVGLAGLKVFRCADFMDLLRNERLWFDRGLHVVSPRLRIIDPFEPFGGVVSHAAGLWINPQFRNRGVSAFVPEYVRALAVKLYAIDWQTMFVFAQHQVHAVRAYGYSQVEKVIDGYCPITDSDTELYMGRMSRREIIGRLLTTDPAGAVTTAEVRQAPATAAG